MWFDHRTNKYALVGAVSYGSVCAGAKPGVNTDVTAYLDWINNKIEGKSTLLRVVR